MKTRTKKQEKAEAIPSGCFEMEEVDFDEAANRHCIKTGTKAVCFCMDIKECGKLKECEMINNIMKKGYGYGIES